MTTEVLTYVISAGAMVRAPRGRLFFVKTAANPVSITASGRPGAPIRFSNITAGLKYGPVPEGEHWEYLEITSATAQTVEIIIGDDDVEVAGTVSIAGTVSTQINPTAIATVADVTVPTVTLSTVLGASTRRSVTVQSVSTNAGSVRVGDGSTGAARGLELQPGQALTIFTSAAIAVYNPNATGAVVSILVET